MPSAWSKSMQKEMREGQIEELKKIVDHLQQENKRLKGLLSEASSIIDKYNIYFEIICNEAQREEI